MADVKRTQTYFLGPLSIGHLFSMFFIFTCVNFEKKYDTNEIQVVRIQSIIAHDYALNSGQIKKGMKKIIFF